MDTDTTRTDPDTTRREGLVTATVVLAALAWAIGTPVLGYGAMITATPFFGELPTAAEEATASRLAAGAAACGLGAPLLGLVVALRARRRTAAVVFGVALTLTLCGVAALLAQS